MKDHIETSKLQDLSLAGNKINLGAHNLGIKVITELIHDYISQTRVLRSLDLSLMELSDEIGVKIVSALENNFSLIHFDLSGNDKIGSGTSRETIKSLANVLKIHQYLKYLNLSNNKLRTEDLKLILGSLKKNQVVSHINLSGNDFSGIIADQNNKQYLDLNNHNIDFENLLHNNTELKYLNLAKCKLSAESLKALFAALKENSSLEVLDIRGNTINHSIIDDIVKALRANTSQGLHGLKILYIDQGDLESQDLRKLTDKSLGISVIVDDGIPKDLGLSEVINPTCTTQSWDIKQKNLIRNDEEYDRITLETATSSGQYNYWLQQHDIPDIARVHYGYQENELEVVGSITQLDNILQNYRNSGNTRPYTIILNIGNDGKKGNHWVSLVLHTVSDFHAYYINSDGTEIPMNIVQILYDHRIRIHDLSMQQQKDNYNCGLWALENASAICNVLTRPNNNINIQDIVSNLPRHSSETLHNLRTELASELSQDDQRLASLLLLDIDLRGIGTIPEVYRNNFSVDYSAAVALAGCLASYAITSSKSKRSIGKVPLVNSNTVVDGKGFLHCTNQLSTDVFIPYLISVLSRLRIKDDNTCDKVEQFFLEQKVIDDLKKEIPEMDKTGALITKALETNNIELFKVVCKRYSNKFNQVVDVDGRTLLHKVVHYDDAYQWVHLLIDYGINIDVKDSAGNTALYYSIIECKYEVTEFLVNHPALQMQGLRLRHQCLSYS